MPRLRRNGLGRHFDVAVAQEQAGPLVRFAGERKEKTMTGIDETAIAAAQEAAVRKGVRRWAVKQVVAIALIGGAAFLAAGRVDWAGGWVLVGILAAYSALTGVFLVPRNPALYAERSGLQKGTKRWDVALAFLVAYTPLFLGLTAGLDVRYRWAAPMAVWPRVAVSALTLPGLALLSWAMMSNTFFSATVRIQNDRGQTVVSSGPYRAIRHPGYVGGFLFYAGLAGALGSVWGFLTLGISLALLVLRTALEDATLRRELSGYEDYCRRTRFRLLPGVW